jgi:glycogen debranching enzyme
VDLVHTELAYVPGSLANVDVDRDGTPDGFMFALSNPPIPYGGKVVDLALEVDEVPVAREQVTVATQDAAVSGAALSPDHPILFKPFEGARFLVLHPGGLAAGTKHQVQLVCWLEGFGAASAKFTFSDFVYPGHVPEALVTEWSNRPLVLAGRRAYVVASATGDLSAMWDWMGIAHDNGGLFVPPARAMGRIVAEVAQDDLRVRLGDFVQSSRHEPGFLLTTHEILGFEIQRRLFVPLDALGAILEFDFHNTSSKVAHLDLILVLDANISSYGLPGLAERHTSRYFAQTNCLAVRSNRLPYAGAVTGTRAPFGRVLRTHNDLVELTYHFRFGPNKRKEFRFCVAGSPDTEDVAIAEAQNLRGQSDLLKRQLAAHFATFLGGTLDIALERPLDTAFTYAKVALDYLKAEYPEIGSGICAGLPRFPNYWGRDTAWTLHAYLDLGDYPFVATVLRNFLRYQAREDDLAQDAVTGELPMLISGTDYLHRTGFGAADATLLFPELFLRYVQLSGDLTLVGQNWPQIEAMVGWGSRKDQDGDGLIEHGGELANVKFSILDTTWMDHVDRRSRANDVQALHVSALRAGAQLAHYVGREELAEAWEDRAARLTQLINQRYWDTASAYYFDTVRADGTPDRRIRPNALVLALTGVADKVRAQQVLQRVVKEDLTTPWGVRTLSSADPSYRPQVYHDGAVWPLVTGWAALVAYRLNQPAVGADYVRTMADRIREERGMFAETYRGDRPLPFNSCILQAWSVGLFVSAVTASLGLQPDALSNRLTIEPRHSADVPTARVRNLRLGSTVLSLDIDHVGKSIQVSGKGIDRLTIASPNYDLRVHDETT